MRLGRLVDLAERLFEELDRVRLVGVEAVGAGGEGEQRRVVDARQRLRFGDPRPERQGAVEERRRGARRAAAFDRAGGGDRGAERLRLVARGVEVVGDRGGADRQRVVLLSVASSARASPRCSSARSPGSRSS